jgi:hypothetical protein
MRVQIAWIETKEIIETPLYLPNIPLVGDFIYIPHSKLTGIVHQISYTVTYNNNELHPPTIYLKKAF